MLPVSGRADTRVLSQRGRPHLDRERRDRSTWPENRNNRCHRRSAVATHPWGWWWC